MPDSKAIILESNRTGHEGIYKQSLEADTADPVIIEGVGHDSRVTADGKWILYFGKTEAPQAEGPEPVMRVPVTGGTPQSLFIAKRNALIVCARSSNMCAIAEASDDNKRVTISALDPLHGRGAELTHFELHPDLASTVDSWWFDLSPDGTRVAATPSPTGPIYILSLRGQPTQYIHVKGWSNLISISWAAGGKGLFVVSGSRQARTLLYVDLHGNTHFLWDIPVYSRRLRGSNCSSFSRWSTSCYVRLDPEQQYLDDRELLKKWHRVRRRSISEQ